MNRITDPIFRNLGLVVAIPFLLLIHWLVLPKALAEFFNADVLDVDSKIYD